MPGEFLTEPLHKRHDRKSFSCIEPVLNDYLHKYARLDMERKETAVFVHCDEDGRVRGYYTLSALHVPREDFSAEVLKKLKLSPYKLKPATLLGRLAVDQRCAGRGLGPRLLIDALRRSYYQSEQIGSMAVVVDALHEKAAGFYLKFGFIPFPDQPLRLFLPMKTVGTLF
ncbi:MAG: GNAT family N-acetyltransferase [Candidatus Omnitrophica bacterium]|nr:GNAT family N-acetyltransferase [Candidatus Omnitrophota bacterium]